MEEIKKLIVKGNINIEFYNLLTSFTSSKTNVIHLPRILSYLYSQSSLKSKLKAKDEPFISTLVECVVLLIKCSLSSEDIQHNEQLRASCLRNASNFSVILHQEGYENNSILDSTVACVVSMIDSNISWSTEELNQSLANLRSMLSIKLSTLGSKLSLADRHSVWNQLVILYKPIEDKTKLISFLREVAFGKSQTIGDVYYLQICANVFTKNYLTDLFGILDTYYAFAWKSQDTSGIFKVTSHILDVISTENNSDKKLQGINEHNTQLELSCISAYKLIHEITHHITKSQSESIMRDHFTGFTNHLQNLLTLFQSVISQKADQKDSKLSLCQKTLTSILMHLSWYQLKHFNVFVKTETILCILNMYTTLFNMAQLLWSKQQYISQKHDNFLFYHAWYACLSVIMQTLTVTTLHEKLTQVLELTNNFIGNMFLLLYSKNAVDKDDRYDLSSFLSNLGKLSQVVLKLDADNVNRNINMILVQWLLEMFPNIPDVYSTPVADFVMNIAYNCVKTCLPASDITSLLTSLEPLVILCIMNESCVPSGVRFWVRVQYQYKQEHPDYQFLHLCDHIDSILSQVQTKYPSVSFVNTSGHGFVSRVLKCELDEVVTYRQMEKDSTSTSYESSIIKRVLDLIQTLPSQDLILADICLSTLHLTFKLEPAVASTETNAKLKAYVSELKRNLSTNGNTRLTSSTHANARLSKVLDPNNSELVTSEQALVTEHTCVCLLLANYYVIEHFEKVAKKRATVKRSKPVPDGKAQKQKDLDKGIETATNETNVFPTSMDVRETEGLVRILDKVALVLSKVVQSDVALDLTKVSCITKIDRMVSHILYVGYSYRIYLERDKEIEFWKLSLQLSVLLQQDGLFVECVSNLLWLDEGLRPNHLRRTDELVSATLKPPLPSHVKTLYQFAKIKQALSLNQISEASKNLSEIKLEHSLIATVQDMLLQYYQWYLKCQIVMRKTDPTTMDHAYMIACCKQAFKCLFKNYDTVSLTSPVVIHVISCYLDITLLVTRFHTVHLNPTEGRQVLGVVLKFTQDLCLPLWTAQLLSLSAGLDVITCNKDDLLFKTNCLEQVLLPKSNAEHNHHTAPVTPRVDASSNRTKHHFTPSQKVGLDVTRDAVVTMTAVTGSSLASPRFTSTVSNKLPSFIAHRSCQCFECRNSVYQELLVSLGLLQGLYYQLDQDYDLTRFYFQNAEHLLNKLKILKGLSEDVTTEWQSRLLFYRANLEGILCRPIKLLELNQELQAMDNGEGYFDKHFEFLWQQEQYLMFVSASEESHSKANKTTPTTSRRLKPSVKPASMLPAHLLKTPKVQNIDVKAVCGMNTVYPAFKFKDNITPKAKVRLTLAFDEDEEEKDKNTDKKCCKDQKDGNDKESPGKESELNPKSKQIPATPCNTGLTVQGVIKKDDLPKTMMKTTVRRPRRVKLAEPMIEGNKENEWSPPPPPAEVLTGKADEKYQFYTARSKITSTQSKPRARRGNPALVIDTPSVYATPYASDLPDNVGIVSPRSSQTTTDRKKKTVGNRRKVLFDESEEERDDLNPIENEPIEYKSKHKESVLQNVLKSEENCIESENNELKSDSRSNKLKTGITAPAKVLKEPNSSSPDNATKPNRTARTNNRVEDTKTKRSKVVDKPDTRETPRSTIKTARNTSETLKSARKTSETLKSARKTSVTLKSARKPSETLESARKTSETLKSARKNSETLVKTMTRRTSKSEIAQESGRKTQNVQIENEEIVEVMNNMESLQISEHEENEMDQDENELDVSSASSHYHSFSSTPDRITDSAHHSPNTVPMTNSGPTDSSNGSPTDTTISITSSIPSDTISISSSSSGTSMGISSTSNGTSTSVSSTSRSISFSSSNNSRYGFTYSSSSERSERSSSRSSKDSMKSSESSSVISSGSSKDSMKSNRSSKDSMKSSKYTTSSCSVNSYKELTMENMMSNNGISSGIVNSSRSSSISSSKQSTSSIQSSSSSVKSIRSSKDLMSSKDLISGPTKSTRSTSINYGESINLIHSINSLPRSRRNSTNDCTLKSTQSNENSLKESNECTTKIIKPTRSSKHLVKDSSNHTDSEKSIVDLSNPRSSTCSSVILPSIRGKCRKILSDSSSDSSVSSQTSARSTRLKSQQKKTDPAQIGADDEVKTDKQKFKTENLKVNDDKVNFGILKTKTETHQINSDSKIKNVKTKSDKVSPGDHVYSLTKQINTIEIIENDENQAPNIVRAAASACSRSRKEVSKMAVAAYDDHEFAAPGPKAPKRKPRSQFPKSPFIL